MASHNPRGFGGITRGVIQAASASGKRRAPVMRLEELHQACQLHTAHHRRRCHCVTLASSLCSSANKAAAPVPGENAPGALGHVFVSVQYSPVNG